jgi:NitT/TauT family transport system substrate-binding protein
MCRTKDTLKESKFMKNKPILALVFTVILISVMALAAGCADTTNQTTETGGVTEKIPHLVLVGPVGPMAIPLAYLIENDKLADIADSYELKFWSASDQLTAYISGAEEGHFLTLPSNSSALLYNKGMDIQMLDISVWGIQYIISNDPEIQSMADLKGREVVIPFKGNVPDLMFRYICQQMNIDTSNDLTIYYANTPQQAAQLMLSGQKSISVLPEPLATQVLMKSSAAGLNLVRSINMQDAWGEASGSDTRVAIAGTIALSSIQENKYAVNRFLEEYSEQLNGCKTILKKPAYWVLKLKNWALKPLR